MDLSATAEPAGTTRWTARLAACQAHRVPGPGHTRIETIADERLRERTQLLEILWSPPPAGPKALALRFVCEPASDAGPAQMAVHLLAEGASDAIGGLPQLIAGYAGDYRWVAGKAGEDAPDLALEPVWLRRPIHVAEIRRRVTRVRLDHRLATSGGGAWSTSFVHPFLPRGRTLSRLLGLMSRLATPLVWQVTLRPSRLSNAEQEHVLRQIERCEAFGLSGAEDLGVAVTGRSANRGTALHARGAILEQLVRMQARPFRACIMVASPAPLPAMLLAAIGTEVSGSMAAGGGGNPLMLAGGHEAVAPRTLADVRVATANVLNLRANDWPSDHTEPVIRGLRRLLSPVESAGAWALPVATTEGLAGLRVDLTRSRPLPPSARTVDDAADATLLGRGVGEAAAPVRLSLPDRQQHVYVVGKTGTGKTTLLQSMIRSDINAGRGVGVIDPHGDLYAELLASLPPHRMSDVVLIDPTDPDHAVGLNPLEAPDEAQRHVVVREMRSIMERLLREQYGGNLSEFAGPLFFQLMQMGMMLVMSDPERPGTLLEFVELFQRKDYWRRWLPLKWDEPRLRRWVEQTLPHTDFLRRGDSGSGITMGEYLSSKFEDFVLDPRLRRIFGQRRSTIDLRSVMDEGKILLVNLARGPLTEANSRFLGMVLVAMLQSAAMRRLSTPATSRRPFYLYVDEFQSIATQSFATMLSEARKFGLSLVLANQFLTQIRTPGLREAIAGNVGANVCFRVAPEDAAAMRPLYEPQFDAVDLSNLPNYQACVRATQDGEPLPPFSLRVGPAPTTCEKMARRRTAAAREQTRRGGALDHRAVDREIDRMLADPDDGGSASSVAAGRSTARW